MRVRVGVANLCYLLILRGVVPPQSMLERRKFDNGGTHWTWPVAFQLLDVVGADDEPSTELFDDRARQEGIFRDLFRVGGRFQPLSYDVRSHCMSFDLDLIAIPMHAAR